MKKNILLGLLGIVILAGGYLAWSLRTQVRSITANGQEISVRVASSWLARARGLSGTSIDTLGAEGMLFTFSREKARTFWMKGMEYNLDILWIVDGRVVIIDRNVPAPVSRSADPERVSSAPLAIDAVLELPAGSVEKYGIVEGMAIVLP